MWSRFTVVSLSSLALLLVLAPASQAVQPAPAIGAHAEYNTPSIAVPASGAAPNVTLLTLTLDKAGSWAVQAKANLTPGDQAATTGEVTCSLLSQSGVGQPISVVDTFSSLYESGHGATSYSVALEGVASFTAPGTVSVVCSNFIIEVGGASASFDHVRINAIKIKPGT